MLLVIRVHEQTQCLPLTSGHVLVGMYINSLEGRFCCTRPGTLVGLFLVSVLQPICLSVFVICQQMSNLVYHVLFLLC